MFGKKDNHQVDVEVFTVYDSKTLSYDIPTFAINEHDLIRQIMNMFNDPRHQESKLRVNAEDFSIFKIGNYDKKTGLLLTHQPQHVANVHELRAASRPAVQPNQQQMGIVPT